MDTARDTSLLDRDTPSLDGYDENIEPEVYIINYQLFHKIFLF